MKSIVSAKKKPARRYLSNIWGDPKSPLNRREYAPGQHGQRRKKQTDYGEQLHAKQKLKTYYGNVSEKQFHKYYVEAVRRGGKSGLQSQVCFYHFCRPSVCKPWPYSGQRQKG